MKVEGDFLSPFIFYLRCPDWEANCRCVPSLGVSDGRKSLRAKGGGRRLEEGEGMGKATRKTKRRRCSEKRERTRKGGLNDLKRLL